MLFIFFSEIVKQEKQKQRLSTKTGHNAAMLLQQSSSLSFSFVNLFQKGSKYLLFFNHLQKHLKKITSNSLACIVLITYLCASLKKPATGMAVADPSLRSG
jgi:hypothetical protein